MRIVKKVIMLLFLVGAGIGLWSYSPEKKPQELVLYGNVDQRQVELAFIELERIAEVLVEEGMEVQAGQVLARQETRRLEDRIAVAVAQVAAAEATLSRLKNGTRPEEIDQAKASVALAKAEVAFVDKRYERYNNLSDANSKAVSKEDLDEILRQRAVARARLNIEQEGLRLAESGPRAEDIAVAEAVLLERQRGLEQLRNLLDDAELKSPIQAVVNRRLLEPGDIASPQRAVISLAVSSPKWVRAYISEVNLGHVSPDMDAFIYTDSFPDEGIPGRVAFISSVAEFTPKTIETPDLRTSLVYEIRVVVDDTQNRLRLGMPATIRF